MATIAKAFIHQDPLRVWGDGKQIRNWTYVEDIAQGIILALERISDATAVNLGTNEEVSVEEMISNVCNFMHFKPDRIHYQTHMPVGPQYRVADISLARKSLDWEPAFNFRKGLKKTIDWYIKTKDKKYIQTHLEKLLI